MLKLHPSSSLDYGIFIINSRVLVMLSYVLSLTLILTLIYMKVYPTQFLHISKFISLYMKPVS